LEAGQSPEEERKTLDQEMAKLFMDSGDERMIGGDATPQITGRSKEGE
jgi:hypothetical protein